MYGGRVMRGRRAGSGVGKYIQCREPKTWQQKVQLYYDYYSIYDLHSLNNLLGPVLTWWERGENAYHHSYGSAGLHMWPVLLLVSYIPPPLWRVHPVGQPAHPPLSLGVPLHHTGHPCLA